MLDLLTNHSMRFLIINRLLSVDEKNHQIPITDCFHTEMCSNHSMLTKKYKWNSLLRTDKYQIYGMLLGKNICKKIVFEVDYCKNSLPFADQRDKYLYVIWLYCWLEWRNSFMIIKKSLYGSSILTDIRIIVLRLLIRNITIVICNEVFYFSRWKKF